VATQSNDSLEDDDDPLAVIIRKACSRELTDLGLIFNSLNIKVVQSEVADARRRMSAAEAQATADIVSAQQARRAKEAQLEAERNISDKQRELEQTRAANAALIAQAEAKRQEAMGVQRVAELDATQIAQARADAERVTIEAQAAAEADAIRIRTVAGAQAEAIEKVNRRSPPGARATSATGRSRCSDHCAQDRRRAGRGAPHHHLRQRERRRRQRRDQSDRQRDPDRARRAAGEQGRRTGRSWLERRQCTGRRVAGHATRTSDAERHDAPLSRRVRRPNDERRSEHGARSAVRVFLCALSLTTAPARSPRSRSAAPRP
jgi:hypothetical protein